jgi:hypothetical protein
VRRTIVDAAPWVLLAAAIALTGAGLFFHRRRAAARDGEGAFAMQWAQAAAFARIGELGAKVLAVEAAGGTANAAAAERHATARTLYDQAFTAAAMRAVGDVADEGLAYFRQKSQKHTEGRKRKRKKRKRR